MTVLSKADFLRSAPCDESRAIINGFMRDTAVATIEDFSEYYNAVCIELKRPNNIKQFNF